MQDKVFYTKSLAESILKQLVLEKELFVKQYQHIPTLAVILIGDNAASLSYISSKKRACIKIGFLNKEFILPKETTQEDLLKLIHNLNTDKNIDGILVQLPLPEHFDKEIIINNINPLKDVDGFHRYNVGGLLLEAKRYIPPCTPTGVLQILDAMNFTYIGAKITVVGSSNIVGKPLAISLINRNATVTICNKFTKNLLDFTLNADVIILAAGKINLLDKSMVKDGVIVIDVGINRNEGDGSLTGDANFNDLLDKVSYITPVPGGVGLMTVANLMKNTMQCAKLLKEKEISINPSN